jgi:predicted metal-dependent hydrolase
VKEQVDSQQEGMHIEGVGWVKVIRRAGMRTISLSIRPFEGASVRVPYRVSKADISRVLEEKRDWLIRNLRKIQNIEEGYTVFLPGTSFRTRHHSLDLSPISYPKVKVKVGSGAIEVGFPLHVSPDHPVVQTAARKGIRAALNIEARQILPTRVESLARAHGLKFSKLSFRDARTRWGSCSGTNNISLNIHLMRLPDHLVDYVILHELAHTRHKNHGPGFWNFLDELTGGKAKSLAREMRKYRTEIY